MYNSHSVKYFGMKIVTCLRYILLSGTSTVLSRVGAGLNIGANAHSSVTVLLMSDHTSVFFDLSLAVSYA